MFDDMSNNSIFGNDEFGVQEYRDDSNYLFDLNKNKVKLIKYNPNKTKTLQGDFLGVTLNTQANYSDDISFININIMSLNPRTHETEEQGYNDLGVVEYTCYSQWDTDIKDRDIVEFISPYGTIIREGEQFRVVMDDAGLYEGQYTRRQFTLKKIGTNINIR